ncbi:unnamed protein product [Oikopleura dioica]|uniref:Uncharacterized protein n=1 Tax=Oikopleura dioica TaxID=34765 RepID=E4YAA4_OIKDI|nr:unnamed protein product [Oikopleura dioica]
MSTIKKYAMQYKKKKQETPCGEYRSLSSSYSDSTISLDGSSSDKEDNGLLADVSVLRETVIKINVANKKAYHSLKLASSKIRDHRNSIIKSLYHGYRSTKGIHAKTRSGKDITHLFGERVFLTTLGMNITTALDKGYDETVFNATKSIEYYVEDCVHTLNQIKNTLDRKDLLDIVGEGAMEEIKNIVANIFKPPSFTKHQSDFRKWGSSAMKNTLDSGSGMTLEEQVDHDKDKVFKSITADYVILKQSKLNALPKGSKLIAKQSWNTVFGKEAGNALSSFREEMIDTINNRINLLNKFIKEKITFLANASRAITKVEDGLWTYSIKELNARAAIENLADDNMDLVHALMREDSETLYKRESDMNKLAATFSTLRRNPKEMIEASVL